RRAGMIAAANGVGYTARTHPPEYGDHAMSETVARTAAPAPTPNIPELIHQKLDHSTAPLTVKELAKGLARPKKVTAGEFEKSIADYLADNVRAGWVFGHPSGSKSAERYWNRDEKDVIRQAVLAAASEPKKLGDLKKAAKSAVAKVDKKFADGVVD